MSLKSDIFFVENVVRSVVFQYNKRIKGMTRLTERKANHIAAAKYGFLRLKSV